MYPKMYSLALVFITTFAGTHADVVKAPSDVNQLKRFFEGDIAGFPEAEIRGKRTHGPTWPSGTVPYTISPKFEMEKTDTILEALASMNETCVKFVPHSDQQDFIQIEPSERPFSYIGRVGGSQIVGLGDAGMLRKRTVLHQLMHVLGFYHEHTRLDRDDFIDINWSNIAEADKVYFQKYHDPTFFGQQYDFGSIMHYGENTFGKDENVWTMRPNTEYHIAEIGRTSELVEADIRKIGLLYNCTVEYQFDPTNGSTDLYTSLANEPTPTKNSENEAEPITNPVFHVDPEPDVKTGNDMYVVRPGESLHTGQTIWSRTKNMRMTLQENGNLVIFIADDCGVRDRVIWVSVKYLFGAFYSRTGPAVAQLQQDGNLVIRDLNDSTVRWSSNTNGTQFSGASMKLNDDGKLVIYKDNKALWQSGGHTFCLPFSSSPFRDAQVILKSGERLRVGQTIVSSNGKTKLEFKPTGNLAVSRTCDGAVHWSSQTEGIPASILVMRTDGDLMIYNSVPATVWRSASNEDYCRGCADLRWSGGTLCVYRYGSCVWTASSMEEDCPSALDEANHV